MIVQLLVSGTVFDIYAPLIYDMSDSVRQLIRYRKVSSLPLRKRQYWVAAKTTQTHKFTHFRPPKVPQTAPPNDSNGCTS